MYKVYWIHKKDYTDPASQGYIGYTARDLSDRFEEHSNKNNQSKVGKILRNKNLNEDVFITELLLSEDRQKCLDYEFQLRPDWNIGWNGSPGGFKGGVAPGRKTGWKQSEEANKKRSKSLTGNTNGKHKAKPFTYAGETWPSKKEACQKLGERYGLKPGTVYARINNGVPLDRSRHEIMSEKTRNNNLKGLTGKQKKVT